MTVQLPTWIMYINALAIAIGAIAASVLGILSYRLQRRKRIDELFDRRFAFYKKLMSVVLNPSLDGSAAGQEKIAHTLRINQWEARFLFGEDMGRHLVAIADKYTNGEDILRDEIDGPFLKYMQL